MHIHLDAIGGLAGDMFVAALLDALPQHTDVVLSAVRLAGPDNDMVARVLDRSDGVLVGKRFHVGKNVTAVHHHSSHAHGHSHNRDHDHGREHGHHHDHHEGHRHDHHHSHSHHHHNHNHTHWAHLRAQLQASALADGIKRHAIGIFGELAWAEAKVHGKATDDVTF